MAGDRLYRTTTRTFQIVECAQCRLIRLHPRPAPEELKDYYPRGYWHRPGTGIGDRLQETYRRLVLNDHVGFVQRARRESQCEGLVFDVGCGGGLFLRMLQEEGERVVGLDNSLEAAAAAWKYNSVPVVCGDLESAPLPRGSCAMVTMFHVLEHLLHPERYLDAAYQLLKPGGRLVVQVPNASCWQFLMLGENWRGLEVPRHLIDFRVRELDYLLECCGFEVLRHKHFSLRDNPASLATSLFPGLDPTVRSIRGVAEEPWAKTLKDLAYLGLVAASLPFTLLEAACRAGCTVMVEARKTR